MGVRLARPSVVPSIVVGALIFLAPCAPPASAQRTKLKPGINMFKPQQDIDLGKRAATDAQQHLPLCNAPRVDAYLTELGTRLAQKLPTGGVKYPFEFHCVNDKAINAFALPGGYVFVNRGAIEVSDTEAQLAGVMAHELSHVALRHGTNQATKAQLAQGVVGGLDAILGGGAGGGFLAQLGSFAAGGVLLRYSREAETQADVMGTQVLYDSGYDPRALAQFFEKLEAETKGKNPPVFFSDHPNPEHRLERVDQEVEKLGGVPRNAKRDSAEFEEIKREVLTLPVASKSAPGAPGTTSPPLPPSSNYVEHQSASYALRYPENWKKYPDTTGEGVSFAPDGGLLEDASGHAGLAYGLIVGLQQVKLDPNDSNPLETGTKQVLDGLQQSNPNMRIVREADHVRLNGQPGLSTHLANDSPAGGAETDWVITVLRPTGMIYFVCVAPERSFESYDKACTSILDSVRFPK